jgi:hypothetical protein
MLIKTTPCNPDHPMQSESRGNCYHLKPEGKNSQNFRNRNASMLKNVETNKAPDDEKR